MTLREDPELAEIVRGVMREINACTPGTRLAEVPTLFAFGPIYKALERERLAAEQRALREAAEAMYQHFGLEMLPEYYLWLQARADSLSSSVRDGETKQPGKR